MSNPETTTQEVKRKMKFTGKVVKTTLAGAVVDIGLDKPDADRAEAVQSVEDLRFGACKRRGPEMIRKTALLSGALTLHDAAVDADGSVRARGSVSHESSDDGRCWTSVERRNLAVGSDIEEKGTNLSPADNPTAFDLRNHFRRDRRAIG